MAIQISPKNNREDNILNLDIYSNKRQFEIILIYSKGIYVMTTAEIVRLAVLLLLSLLSAGFANWLIYLILGIIISFGLHCFTGWTWVWNFQVGFSLIAILPTFIKILLKNYKLFVLLLIMIGSPVFLVSRFVFSSLWYSALFDGFIILNLLPLAAAKLLSLSARKKEPDLTITKKPDLTWSRSGDPYVSTHDNGGTKLKI